MNVAQFEADRKRLQEECRRWRIAKEAFGKKERARNKLKALYQVQWDTEHLSGKDKRLMRAVGKDLPIKEVAEKFQTEELTAALIIVGVL